MVVVTGEFGRTPKISYANGQPGRDHWPNATSLLFAGGGMRSGQVIGATDRNGAEVIERRVGVGDFLATIYRHLGIDPAGLAFQDFSGRPVPVPADGTPIGELHELEPSTRGSRTAELFAKRAAGECSPRHEVHASLAPVVVFEYLGDELGEAACRRAAAVSCRRG